MREEKIMLRVSDGERESLERVAEQQGLSLATWSRTTLLRHSRNGQHQAEFQPRVGHLKLLSLFCGPGGMDEGFRQAGFATVLGFDNDADCVSTFNRNHKYFGAKAFSRDIRELKLADL